MRKLIIVCALVATVAHAAPPPQALPQFSDRDRKAKLSTAFADIDRLFAEFAKSAHVPGAAWGVVIDGELAHSGSAGVRDVASGAAVDADTVFRIASMTKSFTAMAILKLRDEGKLSLDDPAERYVPELKAFAIRRRTLRGSRSGICSRIPRGFQRTTRGEISNSRIPRSSCHT